MIRIHFMFHLFLSSQDIKEKTITNRLVIEEGTFTTTSVLFQNITSDDQGGALYLVDAASSIIYKGYKSSFYSCSSDSHGGAICFGGKSMELDRCCFLYCTAPYELGQAIYSDLTSSGIITFYYTSFTKCPNQNDGGYGAPVAITFGENDFDDMNVTDCRVEEIYAGLYVENLADGEISYSQFTDLQGDVIIGFTGFRFSSLTVDHINMIRCTMNTEEEDPDYTGLFLIESSDGVSFYHSAFVDNFKVLLHTPLAGKVINVEIFDCQFSAERNDVKYDKTRANCYFNDCNFAEQIIINDVNVFDSRQCWMINPPTLDAGSYTYWFLIFFALFAGVVGYGLYVQYRSMNGESGNAASGYDEIKD